MDVSIYNRSVCLLALDLIQENRVLRCFLPLSGSSRKKPKQEPLRSEAFGFDSNHAEIWKHLYDKFESVKALEIEKTVEPFLLKLRTFLSESEINRVVVLPAGEAVRDAQGRVVVYRYRVGRATEPNSRTYTSSPGDW